MIRVPKVAVAMSGGRGLLRCRGFAQRTGLRRHWYDAAVVVEPGKEDSNRCCTPESMALARRAAALLNIPFYVVDARAAFQDIVVSSFLEGYAAGTTPNPCLQCNQKIRWTSFWNTPLR